MARKHRRYTALDDVVSDLLVENRRLRNRVAELERQRDEAVDGYNELDKKMKVFERNYKAVLAENRRLNDMQEGCNVYYDRKNEAMRCDKCMWFIESDFTYCPGCGSKIDFTVARDEDDWRYDIWRERDL